jgi:hypothetical protein
MKRFLFVMSLVVLGLFAPSARAYPWMIRHQFAKCSSCHVDPMGGETLTHMGRAMSETLLSTPWGQDSPTDASKFLFGVPEPKDIYLGGSLRGLALVDFDTGHKRAFPMQADFTAAGMPGRFRFAVSVGGSRASARYEHSSKARLAGNVEDEDFILVSRYHWLGYQFSDALMLRLGRINLPFGIRSTEHTAWVRAETLTDRESDQQHGMSVVYDSGPLRGELMAVLGNFQRPDDALRDRGYSAYLEYLFTPDLALGLSSLLLRASHEPEVDEGAFVRQAHGLTARYVVSPPIVVLAEANVLDRTGSSLGYVGMLTVDVEPLQGLHVGASGEVLDRGKPELFSALGRGEPQLGAWLTAQWFFFPHFDVRADFLKRQGRGATLLAQLHFYL